MNNFVALSLGWGAQSFTLAAMAALGAIEKPDVCIHADTNHESILTYEFRDRFTAWLQGYGLNIVVVTNSEDTNITDKWGGVEIPAFTITPKGKGQIRRQCTHEWKIRPMRQWLQANRESKPVEMWLGISTDEALRMRDSGVKYIINRFPLIEKSMSRKDCIIWLSAHSLPIPSKSACTFCPFRNTEEWRLVKSNLHDWNEANAVDKAIRNVRPPFDLYIHPSRKPVEKVDLRTQEEMGQIRLWDEECSGICGV